MKDMGVFLYSYRVLTSTMFLSLKAFFPLPLLPPSILAMKQFTKIASSVDCTNSIYSPHKH